MDDVELIEKLRGWPAGFGHDALSALVVAGLMKAAADRLAAITPDHAEWRRCIAIIEEVRDSFLSPEYAMGGPMDSITERFACNRAIDAIRARFFSIGRVLMVTNEGWQNIASAPMDGTYILLSIPAKSGEPFQVVAANFGGQGDYWVFGYPTFEGDELSPTHWRPLPAPPTLGGSMNTQDQVTAPVTPQAKDKALAAAFEFPGGVDDASEIRAQLLAAMAPVTPLVDDNDLMALLREMYARSAEGWLMAPKDAGAPYRAGHRDELIADRALPILRAIIASIRTPARDCCVPYRGRHADRGGGSSDPPHPAAQR